MEINTLRGIATVVALLAFVGITLWAFARHRHSAFEEAANIPLMDEAEVEHE